MFDRRFRIVVTSLVIVAYLAAFFQFRFIKESLAVPQHWEVQFYFLIVLSLILSLLIPLLRAAYLIWLFLILRGGIIILIGLLQGGDLWVEFFLLSSLIWETFSYAGLVASLFYSLGMIVGTLLLQFPASAWGIKLPAPADEKLLSFGLFSVFIMGISSVMHFFQKKLNEHIEVRHRLDVATLHLAEVNIKLQEYAVTSENEAKVNERKRVAREVHDTLGYALTNLIMMMEESLDISAGRQRILIEQALSQANEGLQEVRRAVHALGSTQNDETSGPKAIYRLVKSFEKATHIKVVLHLGDIPWSFGNEANQIAYRLVQEGITNAIRHGKCSEITVYLTRDGYGIRLNIWDNGIGFSDVEEGYGLQGMRERIASIEGTLEISSKLKEGTLVSGWIPLDGVTGEKNQRISSR
ncbi:MAG TPA: sensor histidine kinase [bacterium]|nr:sensor histidine kinase [bacterium]